MDSVNQLPLWTGQSADSKRDSVILAGSDGTFAIRRDKWKFIEKNHGAKRSGSTEDQLYEVVQDIGETKNLLVQNPEVVKELRALLESERKQLKGINGVAWPRQ